MNITTHNYADSSRQLIYFIIQNTKGVIQKLSSWSHDSFIEIKAVVVMTSAYLASNHAIGGDACPVPEQQ